jgi:hypothetical protein
LPPPHAQSYNFEVFKARRTSYDASSPIAEITKGFMHLLKKDVPFFWDEAAQHSFDTLKHALTTAPLLWPPNYNKDFLLYLAVVESTIGMVLVQEDDFFLEYVIYYLSRGLVGPELNYFHPEKLALAAVHTVQWFRHYVLFRKTTVVACHESIPVHVDMTSYQWKNQ